MKHIRQYPRLARILSLISGESDPTWAKLVIDNSRHFRAGMAHCLVTEAWKKRHQYKASSRATGSLSNTDELTINPLVSATTTPSNALHSNPE